MKARTKYPIVKVKERNVRLLLDDVKLIDDTVKKSRKGIGGAPSSYDPVLFPRYAYIATSKMGANDEQLCLMFAISNVILCAWQHKHPEFIKAIRQGRDEWDSNRVSRKLLKRCLGYTYEEVKYVNIPVKGPELDEEGNPTGREITVGYEMIEKEKIIKEVPPDITAIKFWLVNRNSERWAMTDKEGNVCNMNFNFRHSNNILIQNQNQLDMSEYNDSELELLDSIVNKERICRQQPLIEAGPVESTPKH